MATNWLLWGGLAAVIAVIIWKRCDIPFIKDFLCKGGKEAPSVPQLVGSPDITQAVMSPTSADPAAMAEMQGRMQQLGPGGGRDPVTGAFLPSG